MQEIIHSMAMGHFDLVFEKLWENVTAGKLLENWKGPSIQVCTYAIYGIWAGNSMRYSWEVEESQIGITCRLGRGGST